MKINKKIIIDNECSLEKNLGIYIYDMPAHSNNMTSVRASPNSEPENKNQNNFVSTGICKHCHEPVKKFGVCRRMYVCRLSQTFNILNIIFGRKKS